MRLKTRDGCVTATSRFKEGKAFRLLTAPDHIRATTSATENLYQDKGSAEGHLAGSREETPRVGRGVSSGRRTARQGRLSALPELIAGVVQFGVRLGITPLNWPGRSAVPDLGIGTQGTTGPARAGRQLNSTPVAPRVAQVSKPGRMRASRIARPDRAEAAARQRQTHLYRHLRRLEERQWL